MRAVTAVWLTGCPGNSLIPLSRTRAGSFPTVNCVGGEKPGSKTQFRGDLHLTGILILPGGILKIICKFIL